MEKKLKYKILIIFDIVLILIIIFLKIYYSCLNKDKIKNENKKEIQVNYNNNVFEENFNNEINTSDQNFLNTFTVLEDNHDIVTKENKDTSNDISNKNILDENTLNRNYSEETSKENTILNSETNTIRSSYDDEPKENNKSSLNEGLKNGMYFQNRAKEMLININEFRKEKGLNTVSWSSNLEDLAKIRASEIAEKFSHSRLNNTSSLDWDIVYAENIGYANFSGVSLMFNKFQESTEHKEALLNSNYKTVGISCFYSEKNNLYYWVQLFGL